MRKMRKKSIPALLLALCLVMAPFTGVYAAGEDDLPAEDIAAAILASQEQLPALQAFMPEDGAYTGYLRLYLQQLASSVEDGVFCYASGVDATETVVFRFTDESAAKEAEDALLAYLDGRAGDFTGYAPEQAALAETGQVISHGCYAAVFILADPTAAKDAFLDCFDQAPTASLSDFAAAAGGEQNAPEEEPTQDIYDNAAVLAAWRSGDSDGLDERDLAIYEMAVSVIEEVIVEGMSEYEEELAIHDWIIEWAEYDTNRLSQLPDYEEEPENANPYGILIGRRGICLGYTTTFQMFMDMLGIECISIRGYAHQGTDEHAWNMVKLDGEWYCVDVTWDDPVADFEIPVWMAHRYFNVTSQYMRDMDHQWDESEAPEAEGTVYVWVEEPTT